MLVRFEPRDKEDITRFVVGEGTRFWELIEERCGSDVSDYLKKRFEDYEEEIDELPSKEELDDYKSCLTDHMAVEQMLSEYVENSTTLNSWYVWSWLRYMSINVAPWNYGFDRPSDKEAEAAIECLTEEKDNFDKRWQQ